jgi:hypothetical protein
MRLVACVALLVAIGCKGADPKPGAAGSNAPTEAAAPGAIGAAPAGESFFGGDVPGDVKVKPIKSFAIEPGVLLFQPVASWSGGQLPGYDYMSMSKDQTAVFRVATSSAVTDAMGCGSIATAAAMAPARIKGLTATSPARMVAAGKNKFAAKEGTCTGTGPKGPVEVHFIDIARATNEGVWHYAVLVSFPPDAPADVKNEARAWARSLELNGKNGYQL